MIVNLYTGNHGSTDGIEDYIRLIREVVGRRGLPVQVTSDLVPGALNIVIDEFTNYRQNRKIAEFKRQNPDSPLVFMLTEFLESRFGVLSLNLFEGWRDVAAVALMNVYLRSIRRDFPRATAGDYARALAALPVLSLALLPGAIRFVVSRLAGRRRPNPVRRFLADYRRPIYFHWRYLGLRACLGQADAILASHEGIIETVRKHGLGSDARPYLGVLYPELDEREILRKLMVGKKLFIEFTGSVTPFRYRIKKQVDRAILSLAMHNEFLSCRILDFSDRRGGREKDRGAYSMHPPQSRRWPYCSPTRIYRALAVDFNLPILTRHFGQSPIEDLCYVWKDRYSVVELAEMYSDRTRLLEFIDRRLEDYNRRAVVHNDRCVKLLRELGDAKTAPAKPAVATAQPLPVRLAEQVN